jgi:hypothetical protein
LILLQNQSVKQDKRKYNTLDDAIVAAKDINKKGQNIHKAVLLINEFYLKTITVRDP